MLLQWWIMSHLLKIEGDQRLCLPDNINPLLGLTDSLYWGNLDKKRTKAEWIRIFSGLREGDIQWMLPRFISEEIVIRGSDHPFLPLPGIRGMRPYLPIRVMRQFGRKQSLPPTGHPNIYVCDYGEDRIPNAKWILQE